MSKPWRTSLETTHPRLFEWLTHPDRERRDYGWELAQGLGIPRPMADYSVFRDVEPVTRRAFYVYDCIHIPEFALTIWPIEGGPRCFMRWGGHHRYSYASRTNALRGVSRMFHVISATSALHA